jgi:hypothetical protein
MLERALWTGVQSGVALVTVDALVGGSADLKHALFVAGVAAGFSALKTFSKDRLDHLQAK